MTKGRSTYPLGMDVTHGEHVAAFTPTQLPLPKLLARSGDSGHPARSHNAFWADDERCRLLRTIRTIPTPKAPHNALFAKNKSHSTRFGRFSLAHLHSGSNGRDSTLTVISAKQVPNVSGMSGFSNCAIVAAQAYANATSHNTAWTQVKRTSNDMVLRIQKTAG